jgi:Sec-independent protein translocase protein TatA
MRFFNLGATEVFLIVLFAIIAVGPQETIKLAKQGREVIDNVRGIFSDLTSEVTKVVSDVSEASDIK